MEMVRLSRMSRRSIYWLHATSRYIGVVGFMTSSTSKHVMLTITRHNLLLVTSPDMQEGKIHAG